MASDWRLLRTVGIGVSAVVASGGGAFLVGLWDAYCHAWLYVPQPTWVFVASIGVFGLAGAALAYKVLLGAKRRTLYGVAACALVLFGLAGSVEAYGFRMSHVQDYFFDDSALAVRMFRKANFDKPMVYLEVPAVAAGQEMFVLDPTVPVKVEDGHWAGGIWSPVKPFPPEAISLAIPKGWSVREFSPEGKTGSQNPWQLLIWAPGAAGKTVRTRVLFGGGPPELLSDEGFLKRYISDPRAFYSAFRSDYALFSAVADIRRYDLEFALGSRRARLKGLLWLKAYSGSLPFLSYATPDLKVVMYGFNGGTLAADVFNSSGMQRGVLMLRHSSDLAQRQAATLLCQLVQHARLLPAGQSPDGVTVHRLPLTGSELRSTTRPAAKWSFDAAEAVRRQEGAARALGVPAERTLDLGKGVSMKLVLIPAGEFAMGSPADEGDFDESPQHLVRIGRSFYMGAYDVTQQQYKAVMGENPSYFADPSNPVEQVTWQDVAEFCRRLSASTHQDVRLPTEAEWEYACRGGTATAYYFGDSSDRIGDYAWYGDNSDNRSHPVGQKKPNAWGLYDMAGDVYQWCSDWYDDDYYSSSPEDNPKGPVSGKCRVVRGGGWGEEPGSCRSASRDCNEPRDAGQETGFRVVVDVRQQGPQPKGSH